MVNNDLPNFSQNFKNVFRNIDYTSLQLRYLFYVFLFWSSFLFIVKNSNQFKHILNLLLLPVYRSIDFIYEKKQKKILEYFEFLNIIQNITVYQLLIKKFLNIFNYLLSTKREMNNSDSSSQSAVITKQVSLIRNFNVLINMKNFIRDLIYLLSNLKRSISLIHSTLSFNILWILTLPYRITVTIRSLSREMKKFFKTIEQIIQILRLPLEILILIGKFLTSVTNFLRRIKRPNI
jgi:hypothetical protein